MRKIIKKCLAAFLAAALIFGSFQFQAVAEDGQTGTFTAVAMNVDGLPQKIAGIITINGDGPGSDGTKAISQKMATYGWDIIGVSEDFNYHTELMSALTNYSSGTSRGGVSGLSNDTDGLNLIWKNTISVSGESWTSWNDNYASGTFGTGNGADTMIDKGYRFYQAQIAEGVVVDVYILHMDADSDAEDIAARESQLKQLASAIKASSNGNPIIVMGDTNCRYTRENLKTLFIDSINEDSRFTIQDAWIEKIYNGTYPTYGADAMVAIDKGGTYEYPQAEIVDKVFYINNTDSEVTLTANSYTIATDFTDDSGTALADHWPVVVEFAYEIGGTAECEHDYQVSAQTAASCTEAGSKTYTCTKCNDSYTETVASTGHTAVVDEAVEATCTSTGLTEGSHCGTCGEVLVAQQSVDMIGHNYESGVCTGCGAKQSDNCSHDYQVSARTEASCTEAGSKTYTCTKCNDSYTETVASTGHTTVVDEAVEATCTATGLTEGSHCGTCGDVLVKQETVAMTSHNYVDGICTACGAEDPDYETEEPTGTPVFGNETRVIESGKKYVLAFSGTTGIFSMDRAADKTIVANRLTAAKGDELAATQYWTLTETEDGYTISTEIDGEVYYLYRTSSFNGYGYKVAIRTDEPFIWKVDTSSSASSVRFYSGTTYGSKHYLRYYNAKLGWIASTRAAGIKLYEVVE